jgi:predicted NAD/FAD-dependent oxidoreductase
MVKILIIGCGLTGAAFNHYIRTLLPSELLSRISIQAIDAASQLGGRMETHSFMNIDSSIVGQCDLGAQYFTTFRGEHTEIFRYLENNGILKAFDAKSPLIRGVKPDYQVLPHYYTPKGTSSIIQELIKDSTVHMNVRADDIQIHNKKLRVRTAEANPILSNEEFDIITVATTASQAVKLTSNFCQLTGLHDKMKNVRYSSR